MALATASSVAAPGWRQATTRLAPSCPARTGHMAVVVQSCQMNALLGKGLSATEVFLCQSGCLPPGVLGNTLDFFCCQGSSSSGRGGRGIRMEAQGDDGGLSSSRRGRERRRREGIKRVVLRRGDTPADGEAGTEEPRLGTAGNPEILEEPMSTVEKRLREQLGAAEPERPRPRPTVSWRDEVEAEKKSSEYRVPSRQDMRVGDDYMYTQTEFKEGEYPKWAQTYKDAAKNDEEIAQLLEGCLDDPKKMQAKIEERVSKNKAEMLQEKAGAAEPPKVVFKNFDPFDCNIWFQLYKQPTDDDADLLAGVLRSWYMLGKIGAFNSANLQVSASEDLLDLQKDDKNQAGLLQYNTKTAPGETKSMLKTYLHNIGDLEFQNEWGKLWVDLGTSDALALDVLLNALTKFSDDYVGIKQIIFGGQLDSWDGMMDKEDKEYLKIVI